MMMSMSRGTSILTDSCLYLQEARNRFKQCYSTHLAAPHQQCLLVAYYNLAEVL